jgi:hypothetical protein
MEETDVEFDLAEDVEDCVCVVGVVGHGGGVDLVRWDAVVGGRHCVVRGGKMWWWWWWRRRNWGRQS